MGMKFRVLRGNHAEGTYPKGHAWAGRSIVYSIGEIVDSKSNLARLNSPGPLGPKFQRLYGDATPITDKLLQASQIAKQQEDEAVYDDGNGPHGPIQSEQPDSDNLNSLTLPELRKLAKEEDILLPANISKEEAVKVLRKVAV